MNIKDFTDENLARCVNPNGFNHPLSAWSEIDWLCALVGEIGEAANIIKKLNRVRDGITGNKETPNELRVNLADELADVYIYLDLTLLRGGFSLAEQIGESELDAFVERTLKTAGQSYQDDELTLSDLITKATWRAGQMIDVGSNHWQFAVAAVAIIEYLAVIAHIIGATLPDAIRAKFDTTSAKIGYAREVAHG